MRIPPFGVERWFARYEFRVPLNIAESCIQPFTVRELCELCGEDPAALADLEVGYRDSAGSPELRETIARLYPDTGPEDVLVTTGAIEANFLVAQALLASGDRAVVEFPAYQQLYSVPASTGAEVALWELKEEDAYRPDLGALEALAPADRPLRLLTINHPHNPTGATIGGDTMRRLVEFAASRGAYLHSDEVYRGLTLDPGAVPSPSARDFGSRAVAVGSMSKAYGLSGLRLGWIAGPAEVVRRCAEIRDYTSICPSALGERLALLALTHAPAVLARNRALAQRNFAIFRGFLERNRDVIGCPLPGEGVIAFPSYRLAGEGVAAGATGSSSAPSSREFCAALAEQCGTLLVPGECFEREHHFRIGFGYATARLEQGLELLGSFCQRVLR